MIQDLALYNYFKKNINHLNRKILPYVLDAVAPKNNAISFCTFLIL